MFKQSITIFQANRLNKSLLNSLNNYNFKLILKESPNYHEYNQIYNNFLNIHPDNLSILLNTYPQLNRAANLNQPKTGQQSKFYLQDLKFLSPQEFGQLKFNGPLIVDSNNSLLANNEMNLNRLLTNYDYKPNVNLQHLIHPHIAEFADLF